MTRATCCRRRMRRRRVGSDHPGQHMAPVAREWAHLAGPSASLDRLRPGVAHQHLRTLQLVDRGIERVARRRCYFADKNASASPCLGGRGIHEEASCRALQMGAAKLSRRLMARAVRPADLF